MRNRFIFCPLLLLSILLLSISVQPALAQGRLRLIQNSHATARMRYGVSRLSTALSHLGYTVDSGRHRAGALPASTIVTGLLESAAVQRALREWKFSMLKQPGREGFIIRSDGNGHTVVAGADPSGVLYGCLELADQVNKQKALPRNINVSDQPEMVLRGACIGIQKPYYLPGHTVYEYPYTPQTFPWLYNKKLWIQYLDSLVANRMNSLYLWNGHPFASLVRLKDYPYAVEVDEATFKKNEDIYRFLTTEADKRGIWVIQMFYNIIVSKPFAEKNHLKTQDRERPIIPLIADYTRKSIAAFVEKYPNVGLMVCLGEAMEGVGNDDIEWFTKTIIPGVQDGMRALKLTKEPPIVLRAHDTDAPSVMKAALPLYKNLYTEAKFNGEALTTPRPRGTWAQLHQTLAHLGSVQIENVHIMANLEPFRYGSPDFIQQSVIGMHEVMGGNGIHLYPQASYWDWPYTADSVQGQRLLQIERDWIWYAAWSRYAWRANRDRASEKKYWTAQLAAQYGCKEVDAAAILQAYEASGEIAPKLLRRFGITDGNRQTLTLGMLMTQLINPYRYGLFTLLYESEGPEGEMLTEYAEKEAQGKAHIGETPVQVIDQVKAAADAAVAAIEAATPGIQHNQLEFERLKNDMYCYRALAYSYADKAAAALDVLRYKYSNNLEDLQAALPLLRSSMMHFRSLVDHTKGNYLYANSMQTQQRKIPVRGADGKFKTWAEMLPVYQHELDHFVHVLDSLQQQPTGVLSKPVVLTNAVVSMIGNANWYVVDSSAKPFADTLFSIQKMAPELKGLKGLSTQFQAQIINGTRLEFNNDRPVQLLVGFFNGRLPAFSKTPVFLKAPELETNATANDMGQADTRIANALLIKGLPPVNVHCYRFPAGHNTLKLAKGACLLLGWVDAAQPVPSYDAGLTENGTSREIDWLFE